MRVRLRLKTKKEETYLYERGIKKSEEKRTGRYEKKEVLKQHDIGTYFIV